MAIKAQKTQLFFYNPDADEVVKVGCPTSISGAGSTNESIETTCLDADTRTYLTGLATPGELSFDIHFDPSDDSHLTLKNLHKSGDTAQWAIGFSDGDVTPSYAEATGWDFDDGGTGPARSNITFEGFITTFEFSFESNDVVDVSVGIQISGRPSVEAKDDS